MKDVNVREGYKSTDVGVIPEDWEVRKVGEVCHTSSGTTPSRKLIDRYYKNGNINWIKTTDLNNSVIYQSEEQITDLALKETSLKIYPPKTVLIAMYGGFNQIGRTGLLQIEATVNQAITAIQPQDYLLDSFYLINYLNYRVNYWKIVAISSRKDPNITSRDVKNFPLPLPPLPEQKTIARVLSDVDELIRECDSLIAKKRDIKQGTMQQLLTGKKRLPGFSGEWEMVTFNDIGQVIDGDRGKNYPNTNDFNSDGYCLFLSTKNVTKRGFYFSECSFITKKKDSLLGQGKLIRNDIVLTTRGTVGNIAFFAPCISFNNIRINSGMVILRNTSSCSDTHFIYIVFKSRIIQQQIDKVVFGSAQPQLTVKIINQFQLPLPTLSEQKAIAQILSDMDAEIEALEKKRDKYKAIKQGMMQELLTGKTRLIDN